MGTTYARVPVGTKRGHLISWRQITGHLTEELGRELSSLEEQRALLNSEPKLHRPCGFLKAVYSADPQTQTHILTLSVIGITAVLRRVE